MKIYKNESVFDAGLRRMEWIYGEFKNVMISYSGGKDSTIVLELALMTARKLGRLPVNVFFLDQEAEWKSTIDQMRDVMYRDEVRPYWIQVPFKISNCACFDNAWLYAWDKEKQDQWVHPYDPISIKENTFGTDRFKELFPGAHSYFFNGEVYANVGGVRAQESSMRFGGLTGALTYKDVTWGKRERNGYTFYPVYDWNIDDVWIAIERNNWKYNSLYDTMYRYGTTRPNMRVSNLHHETAYRSLFMLQEVEPETYNRLCNRLPGISTFSQLQEQVFVKELPAAFVSWREYRDYLLDSIVKPEDKPTFLRIWHGQDNEVAYKQHITEIMVNDITGTKNGNFRAANNLDKKVEDGTYVDKYAEPAKKRRRA